MEMGNSENGGNGAYDDGELPDFDGLPEFGEEAPDLIDSRCVVSNPGRRDMLKLVERDAQFEEGPDKDVDAIAREIGLRARRQRKERGRMSNLRIAYSNEERKAA